MGPQASPRPSLHIEDIDSERLPFDATLQTHTDLLAGAHPRRVRVWWIDAANRHGAGNHSSASRGRRPAPIVERRGHEEGDRRLRRPRDASQAGPISCPLPERIATFDNDGTLWSEQPIYFQLAFAFDRVKALAPKHPEWKQKQPFKGLLEGDMKAVAASGEKGLLEVMAATHAGNTTDEFATHRERVDRHRQASEVQAALHRSRVSADARAARVSAGERLQDLHRVGGRRRVHAARGSSASTASRPSKWSGSRAKVQYEVRDGKPVLLRLAAIDLVDDKAGKPVGIHRSSAAVQSWRSATPTATSRCSSGRRRRPGRASA